MFYETAIIKNIPLTLLMMHALQHILSLSANTLSAVVHYIIVHMHTTS